jgi:glycerol-3-phosphate O-acyltransferase
LRCDKLKVMTDHENSLRSLAKAHNIKPEIVDSIISFLSCYFDIIYATQKKPEECWPVFKAFFEKVIKYVQAPYQFQYFHKAIRTPFDYYQLGLDFIRPLINFAHSKIEGIDNLQSIQEKVAKNENVILLANHQTEIDPQIISLLIEDYTPRLAEDMIFVAGHRVTTDPLAIPMSLGRNLLCIYSKRHIDNPPELKSEKLFHNSRTLKVMEELLSEGGRCIYVAPSGGRDRANTAGEVHVAPLDPQSIEMFYLIAKHAKQPVHFHTLALSTYELLPPPGAITKEIGEARITCFAPAYLHFGPEIDMEKIIGTQEIGDRKVKRQMRAEKIWSIIDRDYNHFRPR